MLPLFLLGVTIHGMQIHHSTKFTKGVALVEHRKRVLQDNSRDSELPPKLPFDNYPNRTIIIRRTRRTIRSSPWTSPYHPPVTTVAAMIPRKRKRRDCSGGGVGKGHTPSHHQQRKWVTSSYKNCNCITKPKKEKPDPKQQQQQPSSGSSSTSSSSSLGTGGETGKEARRRD